MYLETQPQGQPVKEKKPSELLREGIPQVTACKATWLQNVGGFYVGCAVGTMAYAAGRRSEEGALDWANEVLGLELYARISAAMSGGESREEIAAWLEAEGK